jgi:hypothetical protein
MIKLSTSETANWTPPYATASAIGPNEPPDVDGLNRETVTRTRTESAVVFKITRSCQNEMNANNH